MSSQRCRRGRQDLMPSLSAPAASLSPSVTQRRQSCQSPPATVWHPALEMLQPRYRDFRTKNTGYRKRGISNTETNFLKHVSFVLKHQNKTLKIVLTRNMFCGTWYLSHCHTLLNTSCSVSKIVTLPGRVYMHTQLCNRDDIITLLRYQTLWRHAHSYCCHCHV